MEQLSNKGEYDEESLETSYERNLRKLGEELSSKTRDYLQLKNELEDKKGMINDLGKKVKMLEFQLNQKLGTENLSQSNAMPEEVIDLINISRSSIEELKSCLKILKKVELTSHGERELFNAPEDVFKQTLILLQKFESKPEDVRPDKYLEGVEAGTCFDEKHTKETCPAKFLFNSKNGWDPSPTPPKLSCFSTGIHNHSNYFVPYVCSKFPQPNCCSS